MKTPQWDQLQNTRTMTTDSVQRRNCTQNIRPFLPTDVAAQVGQLEFPELIPDYFYISRAKSGINAEISKPGTSVHA